MSESGLTIKFEDKKMKAWLDRVIKKSPERLDSAVKLTTAESLGLFKRILPKRTGLLRKSYLSRRIGPATYRIFPGVGEKLQYANAVEFGAAAHTIVPKRAKMLTIPLRDDVLVGTKARISQSALNRLFRELNNRKGRTKREIYDEVGIALALKANIPARRGQRNIEKKIAPQTRKILKKRVEQVYRSLGFK
jgi:hypothetical protein